MQSQANAEVVEIYLPRRLEYLSELYRWLKAQLVSPGYKSLFKGFSLYEVSGAYVGTRLFTEQTVVVRLIFDVSSGRLERVSHEARMDDIADSILRMTGGREEEVWLIRSSAIKTVRKARGPEHETRLQTLRRRRAPRAH